MVFGIESHAFVLYGGTPMPWETFTRDFVRTTAPKVTVTNLGRFALNNSSSALVRQNDVESVLLLWDASTRKVGIQPTKAGDHRAYTLSAYGPKGKSGTGFSAVTFLNHINYDWSETRSFPAEWTENMLVFTIPAKHLTGKPMAQDGTLGALRRKDRLKKQE